MDEKDTPSKDEHATHIAIILRQTDYTEDEANKEYLLAGNDYIKVIKKYLGIIEPKPSTASINVNQEIYKQMRFKLNHIMRDYSERKENHETRL
tara:strand:- start:23559 stop:23840 length:282 start_codon:yes stop_codon:yes gene_type:complete